MPNAMREITRSMTESRELIEKVNEWTVATMTEANAKMFDLAAFEHTERVLRKTGIGPYLEPKSKIDMEIAAICQNLRCDPSEAVAWIRAQLPVKNEPAGKAERTDQRQGKPVQSA